MMKIVEFNEPTRARARVFMGQLRYPTRRYIMDPPKPPPSITCPTCGRTSYNPNDIKLIPPQKPRGGYPDQPNHRYQRRRQPPFLDVPFWAGVLVGLLLALALQLIGCRVWAQGNTQTPNRGQALYAIDGDTFVDNSGTHIRLWGIDAPEKDQVCDGQRVGTMARNRLAELLKLGSVNCQTKLKDRYGRSIAICTVQQIDIGQTLVREGLAFAYRRYTSAYAEDEPAFGPVHQYHCQTPEDWRRAHPK